jgi:stress-induced morphogen
VEGLSGCTPDEVLRVTPEFIEMLGLKQSLTPSRNNGFLNMLKLMQKKTLQLTGPAAPAAEAAPPADPSRPVYSAMVAKLTTLLKPTVLEIKDDSASHAGHGSAKGLRGSETHFSMTVVSDAFEGLTPVSRHRLVYAALSTELAEGLHALSIDAKTVAEAAR